MDFKAEKEGGILEPGMLREGEDQGQGRNAELGPEHQGDVQWELSVSKWEGT